MQGTQKDNAAEWFKTLQIRFCKVFEEIEQELQITEFANQSAGKFTVTPWDRADHAVGNKDLLGGGIMSVMRGRVFEKVGVNFSNVYGKFSPEFSKKIPGTDTSPEFWASGISLVAHMQSPLVPAVHMNTRHIITEKAWFGGGADLTPIFENPEDTAQFHQAFEYACNQFDKEFYPRFKKWCDDYFYLPHRQEHRGVGGIFYDYLDCPTPDLWQFYFDFTKAIGEAFLAVYPKIVRKHMNKTWNAQQREQQLIKRGRYVEFNLLYDRGTTFGLKTGGNTDAILMSMPPEVKW
ncbi:MAG: coproporphyrinogen III oxidase [Alphaproteobacteria bacterium]|jgi:coproporphyrinogen III oxidase